MPPFSSILLITPLCILSKTLGTPAKVGTSVSHDQYEVVELRPPFQDVDCAFFYKGARYSRVLDLP